MVEPVVGTWFVPQHHASLDLLIDIRFNNETDPSKEHKRIRKILKTTSNRKELINLSDLASDWKGLQLWNRNKSDWTDLLNDSG